MSGGRAAGHGHGSRAHEGPRGTIYADIRARCAPTYVVTSVALDFSQGDVTTPSLQARPFPCDGRWHAQRVSSLEAFAAGPATLSVTLHLADAATGTPVPAIVATTAIYVRPAAKVVLPRTGHVLADGRVVLTAWARCDAPWVLQEFHLSLAQAQGEFPEPVASADAYLDLTCDGVLRPVTLALRSDSVPFRRGAARLEGTITLLDPEQFDPVTQVTTTRTVWLR